jgi:hypothetical protein
MRKALRINKRIGYTFEYDKEDFGEKGRQMRNSV